MVPARRPGGSLSVSGLWHWLRPVWPGSQAFTLSHHTFLLFARTPFDAGGTAGGINMIEASLWVSVCVCVCVPARSTGPSTHGLVCEWMGVDTGFQTVYHQWQMHVFGPSFSGYGYMISARSVWSRPLTLIMSRNRFWFELDERKANENNWVCDWLASGFAITIINGVSHWRWPNEIERAVLICRFYGCHRIWLNHCFQWPARQVCSIDNNVVQISCSTYNCRCVIRIE